MWDNVEIIDHTWYCGRVGIVLARNIISDIQCAYIGSYFTEGVDSDIREVLQHGSTLSIQQAVAFFNGKVKPLKYLRCSDALNHELYPEVANASIE